MVFIRKNWQALPVTAITVTAPDPIQQPTADIVELNKINHDKTNEPMAYCSRPPLIWPKKNNKVEHGPKHESPATTIFI